MPLEGKCVEGAQNYLVDVWRDAPLRAALVHTALAWILLFLPLLILRKPKLFSGLSRSDQKLMQERMMHSRWYLLRMTAYGVRGHALVATLRDKEARAFFLRVPKPLKKAVG